MKEDQRANTSQRERVEDLQLEGFGHAAPVSTRLTPASARKSQIAGRMKVFLC